MASASTHSKLVRGTHEFHIVGAKRRKPFGRVANCIKSAAFQAGGHTWQLACRFDDKGELESISLELLDTNVAKDVMAVANIRVEDPLGEWPPGACPNDGANVFSTTSSSGRSCNLWEPGSKRVIDHESLYARDDRLTVHCTVDVVEVSATDLETMKCFVSVVPPPTICDDLRKLLLLNESEPEMRQRCLQPDVTFVVQQTEIQAHKLVLAMRSPVFAAEFHSDMTESTILTVDNMAVSTFRAMLSFIYTDELTMKQSNEKYAERTMALDLLVAADWYDLERLRIMCENILSGSLDTTTVMATLLLVHGQHSCRQLESSCIEFIASDPEVYAAVMKTEEYQELVKSCSPLIMEIVERTARHNASRNSSSYDISRLPPEKSWSTYNGSEEMHGAHKFRIPNFCAVQKSHGVGESINSNTFQVGGYDWTVMVSPSGEKGEGEGNISVFLKLLSHPPAHGVKVSFSFQIFDPRGKSLVTIDNEEPERYTKAGETWGIPDFITMESVQTKYIAHDGSLTIHCDLAVTKEPYTSRTMPTTRAMIAVPESSIAMHLEQLLLSEHGSDVSFLVEGSMIHAHSLVIAARSPILYKAVSASVNNDDRVVRIDDMKAATFKDILHFVYTDKLATLDSMVVAGDMLGAACWFDNARMKAMCENFLADHISEDNALDTLKVARQHHCLKLEDYCMEFILSLPPQLAKDVMKKMRLN